MRALTAVVVTLALAACGAEDPAPDDVLKRGMDVSEAVAALGASDDDLEPLPAVPDCLIVHRSADRVAVCFEGDRLREWEARD